MSQNERSGFRVYDVRCMSAHKPADIKYVAMKALNAYTVEQLKSEDELSAVMFGAVTVFPRRIGRTRVVFLCYNNGKLLGSMRVDTARA